ncbi:MAG: neutral/alkaline non-lysosomal ceramidase N-terminal domain-containing protein [Bacteroidetes bacterium]|nr:neutral/alkaline non-lysosomal ceramidase N-terminal domain-containing protein [Bacteroidota bacterium]MBS1631463.1 neutral/alkaline non-lysosomal ceramidase N-terminal domain-containing protein [Bacteroidota bacterium]
MKKAILISILSLILFSFPSLGYSSPGTPLPDWKAGVAKANITPNQSMWMAGYAVRDRPSEGKRTDLWAKALALEDLNGKRIVFVSMDLAAISKSIVDEIKNRVERDFNLKKDQVILNVSHTHTGPATGDGGGLDDINREKVKNYTTDLKEKLVSIIGAALKQLQPAKVNTGNGVVRFQVNRRNNNEDKLSEQTTLQGPNEYSVPVIKVTDQNDKVFAILFGYACHNTVLNDYKWSGDYAGYAQIELEKLYPGATALFFQGAGGDQNPLPRRQEGLAEQYGKELAAAVERTINFGTKTVSSKITTNYREIELYFAKDPPTKEELTRLINDGKLPSYQLSRAKAMLKTLNEGGKLMTSYLYPIQACKIGEQTIFALAGEIVVGYAIDLKQIFGYDTFVFGYSNGSMGYIPTTTMFHEGDYEVMGSPMFDSPWRFDIESNIISNITKLATDIGIKTNSQIGEKYRYGN